MKPVSVKISLLTLVTLSWGGAAEAARCNVNATVAAGVAQAQGFNITVMQEDRARGISMPRALLCEKIGAVGARKSGPGFGGCVVMLFRRPLLNGWSVTNISTTGGTRSAPTLYADGTEGLMFTFGGMLLQNALITMRTMTFERAGDPDCVNGWRQAFE